MQTCNNQPDIQVVNKLNFELLYDPINLHRVAASEAILVSEIPNIIDEDNVTNAPGQSKTPPSVLRDDYCDELAFPCLFPARKFGHNVKLEVPLSPVKYFNKQILNLKQTFDFDADFFLLGPLLNGIILNLQ